MIYYGVYDYKESNTFRPTIEKRIHVNYPISKTITTRDDSCCVMGIDNEREREVYYENKKINAFGVYEANGF